MLKYIIYLSSQTIQLGSHVSVSEDSISCEFEDETYPNIIEHVI